MSRWLGGRGWCAASGRSFALTRQGVRLLHRFVNCAPAQCCVPPVLAPAEGIVRAGDVLRGDAAPAWELRASCAGRAVLSECPAFGSRPPCGSVGMFCARITPVARFCWNVLRSDHAGRAVLSECPAFDYACLAVLSRCPVFDHACCLPHSAKQDGLRGVPFLFPPWVEIAGRAFSSVVRLSDFMGSLRACAFSGGDPDGGRRDEGTERRGERSRRQGVRALLRNHISTDMFSAGSTLGLRAPDCAKESSTLWTLFI